MHAGVTPNMNPTQFTVAGLGGSCLVSLNIDGIDLYRVGAEVRVSDGLDREAAPRSHDAPGVVIARWVAKRQCDLVMAAKGQAFVPIGRAQPEFLQLAAIADCLKIFPLQWQGERLSHHSPFAVAIAAWSMLIQLV